MKDVHDSIADCIGGTPAVCLRRIGGDLDASLYAKLEFLNPGGSLGDRAARAILDDAEARGLLRPGGTVLEAGSLGVGLAMVAASRGYRLVSVVPDSQPEENRASLRAFGARVVVVPANVDDDDPRSARSTAQRLLGEIPNSFLADPCSNPQNPMSHHAGTGPEIWDQFDGRIDVLFCGMGTGGAVTGVGHSLKERNADVRIVGIDPVGSLFYDYFHTGQITEPHPSLLEGIGQRFLPCILDFQYLDDVIRVNERDSFQVARRLVREEGLFVGPCSGAVVAGALRYLHLHDREGLVAVALLPDAGHRSLSRLYDDTWMRENGFLDPDGSLGTVADLLREMGGQDLVTVRPDARVPEVIGILKLHGISQVPVVNDGRLLGILTENRLLERALGGGALEARAADLVESAYSTVDRDTELTVVLDLFRKVKVAIVLEEGAPAHILTRIDLIDFISKVRPQ